MAECDFIVVGAGSAGCVLANRLSADPANNVVLLEAGGSDDHPMISMPLAWMNASAMPRFGWGTQSEPEPYLDDRVQPLPRGKLMGGCSSINGTMYIRGMKADYDGWRDSGLPGWGYDDVLPYFKRAESNWRGEGPEHGGDGPLSVTPMKTHPELYPAFIKAAKKLGYPESEDFNVAKPEGFGIPDCTIRSGRRNSTAKAYYEPVQNRRNLHLIGDAQATRILVEHGRAVGIEYRQGSDVKRLKARREVIISAGAFHSPHLLQLSGIGPAAHLQDMGIGVLKDLPGVGENLQDHPIALTFWKAAKDNTFDKYLRLDRLGLAVARWMLTGRGFPAQSPLTVQGFYRSSDEESRPDIQFQVSHTSYEARPWFPLWRKGAGHQLSAGCLLLNPESRGRVSLASPDAAENPRILLNFLKEEADRRKMRDTVRFMRKFFATEPVSDYVAAEIAPGSDAASDEAIDGWLRATVMSGGHPTSTCAMGTGDRAVLNEQLQVRGIDALRVVDASAMPGIIRGNTNAPTIMMAEKASDMILGKSAALRTAA
ncbi:GMC family oxidoreductase [Altericroceibacterium endophyticum]|uniref:Choline dehydrogenase n=1 Tax=Altericroceibacterium endophyticum TaxID=1808508 RepID=A0A6I4T5R1_9SPHN|nr:GMC family oxidoreductase N-terminal domain-containing protein [Altericroceibacterium endophyticum]MXO65105.1 choline dehydrogenase [Altericroceibacterium endophyticum]